MMLRATVVDVNPRDPTRVWVTIPQKYGAKPLRVFTRVQVTKGDHVYVANTSVTRIPQWVVFDQQTEIGRWGNPYPHTHPMGQVDGLVDWVKEYEAWAKDHTARLDAADKQIADGKLVVTQVRKDLDQAQTDIAEAVRKATLEQARLDQAEANLDQMGRNLLAAGGRISANETALSAAQKRIDVAESTVAQASNDLTALQGTVVDVSAKAEASDQKATDALTKAGAAQASADGKNRITRATTPASQPGTAVGDTHFTMSTMGGGGRVIRQQRWDGSTWQDETVSHEVIASLDLGKATVGELDGIRVKARTLSADRFTVGVAGNLIVDPNFNDPIISGWRESGRWKWVDQSGEKCFSVIANGSYTDFSLKGTSATGPSIPVTSGVSYVLTMDVKGDVQVFLYIRYANGAVVSPGASSQTLPGTGRRVATVAIRPDDYTHSNAQGTKPVELTLSVRCPSRAEVGSESAVYSARFAPRTSTVLIEDGAITGEKVEASSVSGAIGQFLKLEAQSGTFTDSLTGRNARLLGETVAESINITGTIRGRDAILSGTVDINQLNVTGDMSAKIISTATLQARQGFFTDGLTAQDAALLGTTVAENLVVTDAFSARVVNAMTAQTKQLVVTEDAILNKATVIQSLVTPELIAQKADIRDLASRMITSGLLQTNPAANRGVKIGNAGIRAWDDAGRQTVNLNGKANYITGTFATAEKEQRVEIKSGGSVAAADFYGSGNTVDHLGVWHQADQGVNTVSKIVSQNQAKMQDGNPGLLMYPFRGEFAFRGRWAKESDTVKFVKLKGAGLPPGGWIDLRITYVFPFSSLYSDLHTIVSAESWSGQEILATVITNARDQLLVRLVNKSSTASGTVVLHAAVFNVNSVAGYTEYA